MQNNLWPVLKTPCLKTRPPPRGGYRWTGLGYRYVRFPSVRGGARRGAIVICVLHRSPGNPQNQPRHQHVCSPEATFTTRITKNIDSPTLAERLFGLRAMKYKHFCSPELPQGPPRDPRGPPRDPAGPLRASPGDPRGPPRDPWAPHVQWKINIFTFPRLLLLHV